LEKKKGETSEKKYRKNDRIQAPEGLGRTLRAECKKVLGSRAGLLKANHKTFPTREKWAPSSERKVDGSRRCLRRASER